jgi:peptidylprolyl isomerase
MKTLFNRFASALPAAALLSASLYAQTTPKPATAGATKPAAHKPSATSAATASTAMKLPPNIPVVRGIPKTSFALKYIDSKLGTGALAQPGWKYSVHYTGWLHDGTKFDSSVDRGTPIDFIQGAHRVITGWDDGFDGMRVGGKRRLFIPYQLAYGAAGRGPIPPKADLIFDIELVAQSDPNAPPPPLPAAAPAAPATPPATNTPPAKPTTPQ